MDKNAIKKYAVWARRELIERVSQRAMIFGITTKDAGDPNADSVNGYLLSQVEKRQRQALIRNIKEKGYEQVIEEVAYTWFNRFAALRFMEVNGYLPSHIRVFTNDAGEFKPQILAEVIHLKLDGLDMNKVYELENANKTEELFKYLLIVQCNALNSILPGMFQRIEDYTELLLPDHLLREDSVIEQMVTTIPENDWTDQVQIIGWLYQYYNTEPKDKVFADLKKNIKISKENIPAATQLFTPDWIVRYMVENSLGRLWLEGHPNDILKSEWKYYLDEAEQEPEVQAKLTELRKEYASLRPEEIKCIDPCMGSGHILCYMFDVLVKIYEDYGYTAREAAVSIVQNNLYGLDIDDRAAQLAYFAVMMKARQYDRRFLSRGIQPHVHVIVDSKWTGGAYQYKMGNFLLSKEHQETLNYLLDVFRDAKEYGSILQLENRNYQGLLDAWKAHAAATTENFNLTLWYSAVENTVPQLIEQAILLSKKYDIVVTNPPYMASSNMSQKLFSYVKRNYDDGRNDFYTVFILKCCDLCKRNGHVGMITQLGWMSLIRSSRLRDAIYLQITYRNMVHLGSHIFDELSGEVVKTGAFVYIKNHIFDYKSTFVKLDTLDSINNKKDALLNRKNLFFASARETYGIEGAPLSYWLPRTMIPLFSNSTISTRFVCRAGMQTGNNDMFLRFWYEPNMAHVDHFTPSTKWYSYNKGGSQRKWYGNVDIVVNWQNDGFDIKSYKKYRLELGEIEKKNSECWNSEFYFVEGATWSSIASGTPMFRFISDASIFDIKGPTCFAKDGITHDELLQVLGYLNSPIVRELLSVLSPTLDCNPGTVSRLPYISQINNQNITNLVKACINLSKQDWDAFETSWDFQSHPLVSLRMSGAFAWGDDPPTLRLSSAYKSWQLLCEGRFNQLKANEEELNRIFIDIYGLQDELTPKVEDKDVTVRKADLSRDIRSLISYAVGCMFGRYSLDVDGLILAGQDYESRFVTDPHGYSDGIPAILAGDFIRVSDNSENIKVCTYLPDKDNIIPICDDEYFDDDITGRFVTWIETVYGRDTLEENLKFIADALEGKGTPREVIRNYFINDFYADHLKIYQKRPIYWLFDSGKKNGFKALIYMHRYQPDTIARIRTDYVHEQQSRYRTAIADLEQRINDASTSERVKLSKQLAKLQAQAEEIRIYEEKIHHLADQMIKIDLDDGVKKNYDLFRDVLAKIK